jgi:hypothetical protein
MDYSIGEKGFWLAAHTAGGFGLGGEDRWWWDLSDPEIGAELGERRIMLGTIAEPRKKAQYDRQV